LEEKATWPIRGASAIIIFGVNYFVKP